MIISNPDNAVLKIYIILEHRILVLGHVRPLTSPVRPETSDHGGSGEDISYHKSFPPRATGRQRRYSHAPDYPGDTPRERRGKRSRPEKFHYHRSAIFFLWRSSTVPKRRQIELRFGPYVEISENCNMCIHIALHARQEPANNLRLVVRKRYMHGLLRRRENVSTGKNMHWSLTVRNMSSNGATRSCPLVPSKFLRSLA